MDPGFHLFQRGKCRESKFHDESTRAQVASKMLAEHALDIRFVIDDHNIGTQFESPAFFCNFVVRGSVITNSVKTPGSVSTSILPPCCLTMMSCVIERPRPVPSPAGLVVKNGLNIFPLTSSGMPVPLSRIRISTFSPRFLVPAERVGSKPSPTSDLRFVVA